MGIARWMQWNQFSLTNSPKKQGFLLTLFWKKLNFYFIKNTIATAFLKSTESFKNATFIVFLLSEKWLKKNQILILFL